MSCLGVNRLVPEETELRHSQNEMGGPWERGQGAMPWFFIWQGAKY